MPTLAVLAALAAAVVLAVVDPARAAAWLAKEGPVEHASHAVLLLAVLAWVAVAVRRERRLAGALALFLALVLAEELDWGAVYGWGDLGEAVARGFGHRNMHNAARGGSYLLFAAPLVAWFAWPRVRLAPTAGERLAFFVLAAAFVAGNLTAWERQAQELLEALVYALLLAVGLRHLRARAG